MPTFHLLIKGKVQGVFFRGSAVQKAEELGITGWISNTKDSNVEAVITGKENELEEFIQWCRVGPRHAHVTDVSIDQIEYIEFPGFEIRR